MRFLDENYNYLPGLFLVMVEIMFTNGVATNVLKNAEMMLKMDMLSWLSGFKSANCFFGGSLINTHK